MKPLQPIVPPTKKEQFTLRLMIILGLISMGFFLNSMLSPLLKGHGVLYWMLIATFLFTCVKILYEWVHYFFITVPKAPANDRIFTVDIFTTFCAGEPYEMIRETLIAIQAITYPHETYLCDEADDPYLKELCAELGVNHVTRIKKINAKAGNINNALKQSSGELCLVLDPDHVPFPNFLDPIVAHFNNPEIGFVQVVQAYSNNFENLIAKGAAQQTYQFYGPIMMTMNKYGTVLAIGANCTFRRTALDSIGGHAAGLAEDMHTAMQLHSKGWKSVYVPQVLARGLVPSTLSAYYKQQLKWSRGVFDLLVHAYPKLFKGFSWQQKIHYALIPMHYVSGLMYLITFLIPILSLFFDISPVSMNISGFALTVLPFVTSTLMIRHFVQWWVMEDDERGFHIVGGLLMIGTWWIFILGLVYTIIGKKVPYVPTPKDGNEANNWPLNIPNLVILFLSIAAIVYGLNYDWNPYNIIMACFAGLNSLIMLFNILASRQQEFAKIKNHYSALNRFAEWIKQVKINFWLIRRRLYTGVRSTALIIIIILCCSLLYVVKKKDVKKQEFDALNHKKEFFLTGIFAPVNTAGLSSVAKVSQYQKDYKTSFDLISIYIPWGNQEQCYVPISTVDSIYKNGSIPMITWEPWQNLFNNPVIEKDEKVFRKITSGAYDKYLQEFCLQLITLNKPVYIRFAHEMDNPFYPWSQTGKNTADEFKAAWKYVYDFFENRGVYNVIWVWNPWKAEKINAYFPGAKYVDWIGVTNLNYGSVSTSGKWTSMQDLYQPFHQNPIFRSGIPVMLAEMGTLASEGDQDQWFKDAFKARNKFKEIKGFVFFNSSLDKNVPVEGKESMLDWNIRNPENLSRLLQEKNKKITNANKEVPVLSSLEQEQTKQVLSTGMKALFAGTRGINYNRAEDWKKNYQTVTMKQMEADFDEMKKIGINTIKRYGGDIYDRNILKLAKKTNINIHFGYWISDELDFVNDKAGLEQLSKKILNSVRKLKDEKHILSWNIGNPVLQKQAIYYYKPELVYQQDAYVYWLRHLIQQMKAMDPTRMVTVDVEISDNLEMTIQRLKKSVPQIDGYGLVVDGSKSKRQIFGDLKAPYFYSHIDVSFYKELNHSNAGVFIADWQDEYKVDQVRLNGIVDYFGRKKHAFLQLESMWNNLPLTDKVPKVKVLKPALGTFEGEELFYHALIKKESKWVLANTYLNNFRFEWYMARVDEFNNPVTIQEVGTGPDLKLKIPDSAGDYRLYLYVIKDNVVLNVIESELNTPL